MSVKQEVFQKIEGKLYWYYETERKLEYMRCRVEGIEQRRRQLIELRKEYQESCAYQGATAQYSSERVQGKKSIYHSPIDSAYTAVEDLNDEILLLWEKQVTLMGKITQKEEIIAEIKEVIGLLDKSDQEICKCKYKYRMSLQQIGLELNISKSTVRNRRVKIVDHISKIIAGAE